ncbi:MAG: VWA domain-containing protein [Bacteroidetes bacterium]|nr:VWA domain-containing protein [Bacteroidota bacterium]
MHSLKKEIVRFLIIEGLLWVFCFVAYWYLASRFPDEFFVLYPFYILLNVLVLGYFTLYFYFKWKWKKLSLTWNSKTMKLFFKNPTSKFSSVKLFLFRTALFFILLALTQPIVGVEKVKTSGRNAEVMLVVDISNSMNTCDIQSNISRLQIVKRGLNELLNNCKGERIGIVLFAQNAFVNLPLTKDYSAAKLFVNEIDTKMISNQGTNFQAALEMAQQSFTKEKNQKAILLFTDGENHSEIPNTLLETIKSDNDFLAVVGIGTASGGPIPYDLDRPELGYMTNESGKMILSKVDQSLIRKIAQLSNGKAVFVNDAFPNLSELLTQINRVNQGKVRDLSIEIKSNQYLFPLLIGIICWLLSLNWLSGTRQKQLNEA